MLMKDQITQQQLSMQKRNSLMKDKMRAKLVSMKLKSIYIADLCACSMLENFSF